MVYFIYLMSIERQVMISFKMILKNSFSIERLTDGSDTAAIRQLTESHFEKRGNNKIKIEIREDSILFLFRTKKNIKHSLTEGF